MLLIPIFFVFGTSEKLSVNIVWYIVKRYESSTPTS